MERGSLPATFFVLSRVFFMANDNSRKFKQNQIMFCIQPLFVEYSRPVVYGEDRLRGRGSLPATFFINDNFLLLKIIVEGGGENFYTCTTLSATKK